jgi:hypothetical protein
MTRILISDLKEMDFDWNGNVEDHADYVNCKQSYVDFDEI